MPTDSHMHTRGHTGRFKDRSCWTHPHGDKGRGRLPLHSGAHPDGTHPREAKSGETAYAHTHAQGRREMLSHTRARRSRCHPHRESHSPNACMHTPQLHTASQSQKILSLTNTHALTCAQSHSHCHSVKQTDRQKPAATHQYVCAQLSNKYSPGPIRGAEVL